MRKVYLETSFISYLTSELSPLPITAGRQLVTKEWWESQRNKFDLYVSDIVIDEISKGSPNYSQKRMEVISGVAVLESTEQTKDFADILVKKAIPIEAYQDALHVANACLGGMDFVLTWNFKHIVGVQQIYAIIETCEEIGFECPRLCTPPQLLSKMEIR